MLRQALLGSSAVWLIFLSGCVTVPPAPPPPAPPVLRFEALIRLSEEQIPRFSDDLDIDSLKTAARQSLAYFERQPAKQSIVLGPDSYTVKEMRDSMTQLIGLLEKSTDLPTILASIGKTFTIYQSTGTDPQRTVVFTSYYEPSLAVRAAKDDVYRFPLYARPADLVTADLGAFDGACQGSRISGRVSGRSLVPYSTRADIDSSGVLKNKGLELAWAKDPMDVLDLQIEGSGWLEYDDPNAEPKRVRIRYDGDNGHRYRSVGQHVIASGRIPKDKFTREKFWKYMNDHPKERQQLLNVNARYIFFRLDNSSSAAYAFGNIEVALTPGRSIATDPKLFPKGALAWIDISVSADGRVSGGATPTRRPADPPVQRFVLNQDEGGAIQGPGRVDVFAGHGQDAKHFATQMWNKGRLFFLVKKKT